MESVDLFGVPMAKMRFAEALDWVFSRAEPRRTRAVSFPGLNPIFMANLEREYRGLYDHCDLVLNDGRNIARLVRIMGDSLPEPRIAGMDFLPHVVRRVGRGDFTAYVIAPSEEVYERFMERAEHDLGCSAKHVVGRAVPPFRPRFAADDLREIIAAIDALRPDLVWIGIASPKQEQIARILKSELRVATPTVLCIGGAMETTAGMIPVGPDWIRNAGLESFYRAYKEPRRHAKRYLVYNLVVVWFVLRAIGQRLFGRTAKS